MPIRVILKEPITLTFYGVQEAAEYLDVSRRTILRWVKSGRLVPIPGDKTLFLLDDLREMKKASLVIVSGKMVRCDTARED